METNDKAVANPGMLPKASVLDPSYTFSVSKYQTAAGTADIMSHIFEVYFSRVKDAYMQDRMAEALLKHVSNTGSLLLTNRTTTKRAPT